MMFGCSGLRRKLSLKCTRIINFHYYMWLVRIVHLELELELTRGGCTIQIYFLPSAEASLSEQITVGIEWPESFIHA